MSEGIVVLSLFDGLSGGLTALKRAGIKVKKYYASEIDTYAMKVAKNNHPEIVHVGDVNNWKQWDIETPDLILAGSPCQGFSQAGDRLNFEDPRSKLFFVFVDIVRHYPDALFMLENVKMAKKHVDTITSILGVEPVLINSALVSAQSRNRYYWANFHITQPKDKHIYLRDVVLDDVQPVAVQINYRGVDKVKHNGVEHVRTYTGKSPTLTTATGGGHIPSFVKADLTHSEKAIAYMDRQVHDGRTHWDFGHHSDVRNDKSATVVANFLKGVPYNVLKDWDCIRKFHQYELEALQTLDRGYTDGVSYTQQAKMIGNGWTIDVIVHILQCAYAGVKIEQQARMEI